MTVLKCIAGLLIAIGMCGVWHEYGSRDTGSRFQGSDQCGPRSLTIAAQLLGLSTSLSEVTTTFRVEDSQGQGRSFEELGYAADRLGMSTHLEKLEFGALFSHRGVAILYVNGRHFVVADCRRRAEQSDFRKVFITDPSGISRWYRESELKEIWNGETLLLARNEQLIQSKTTAQAQLAASSFIADFGEIKKTDVSGAELTHEFEISNTGGDELALEIVGSSCACASAELSNRKIAAGGSGSLVATIDINKVKRGFSAVILLRTSDPTLPNASFYLSGIVVDNMLRVDKVDVGKLRPGSSSENYFLVHGDSSAGFPEIEIESNIKLGSGVSIRSSFVSSSEVPQEILSEHQVFPGDSFVKISIVPSDKAGESTFSVGFVVVRDRVFERIRLVGGVLNDVFSNPKVIACSPRRADRKFRTNIRFERHSSIKLSKLLLKSNSELPSSIRTMDLEDRGLNIVIDSELPSVKPSSGFIKSKFVFTDEKNKKVLEVPVLVNWKD